MSASKLIYICSSALTITISFLPRLQVTSVLETWAWDTCGTCWNVVPVFWGNKSRRGPRTLSVEQVQLFLSNSTSLFTGMYKKYFLLIQSDFSTISLNFWSKFTGKLTELKFLLQNFHFSHTFYHTIFRTILLFSSSRYAYHFNEFGVGDNLHPQNIVDRSFKLVIFSANTAGYMHWKTTTRQLIIESI